MAKKKADTQLNLFPDNFGADVPEPKAEAKEPDIAAEMAKLRADFVALKEQSAREIESLQQANMALMSQPAQQQEYKAPELKPTDVDLRGLPDPNEDATGYAREMAIRYNTAMQNREYNAQVQQQQQQQGQQKAIDYQTKLNGLWDDYAEAYPEYADRQKLVVYGAEQVAKAAAAKGVNLDRYMFGNSPKFIKDVKKYLDKEFGPLQAGDADTDDDDDDDQTPVVQRTMGMFGGSDSGNKPSKVQAEPNPTSIDTLREWQLKHGYHG